METILELITLRYFCLFLLCLVVASGVFYIFKQPIWVFFINLLGILSILFFFILSILLFLLKDYRGSISTKQEIESLTESQE
jgi:intracellular septation protein A